MKEKGMLSKIFGSCSVKKGKKYVEQERKEVEEEEKEEEESSRSGKKFIGAKYVVID
ncbi:hypothetical protein [Nostoc sp. NMS9]|uniref:hypothetical protein n=1 Tax=Nostoc sp. NMS9 TaxID=2815393 RepID=UPI0025E474D1|nr:hypothetical protein [Nostoc sp. NMS9]MBN3940005.1 hypothetical protein [Nostoc sp. NMS9]